MLVHGCGKMHVSGPNAFFEEFSHCIVLVDAANSLSPSPYSKPISKGTPGDAVRNISWNTSKEKKLFGIKFRELKEIVKDVLEEYESRGF